MTNVMLSRRNLIAAAIGSATQLDGRTSILFHCSDCTTPIYGYRALTKFCLTLRCPEGIRRACLEAVPVPEASTESLITRVLAAMSSAGRDCTSVAELRHSVRDQSRQDFHEDRTAIVDGWLLSLTETRIYALSALLAREPLGRQST
jgi:hypothetical protein